MLLAFYRGFASLLVLWALGAGMAAAQDVSDKLELCISCHGETGISQMPGVPSIAGRPVGDLAAQLLLFRSGQRQNPQMVMAKRLTEEEIAELSAKAETQMTAQISPMRHETLIMPLPRAFETVCDNS
jgi:cytochrome c553